MAEQNKKRRFVKPILRKVDMRPEEAVLGSCKNANNSGPGNNPCSSPSACFTEGS